MPGAEQVRTNAYQHRESIVRRKEKPPRHQARGLFAGRLACRLDQALALGALTSEFASAAHSFGLLASLLFRRLLEIGAGFHFTEQAFALHLLLKGAQGLLDIIVANGNLNNGQLSIDRGSGAACVLMWPIGPRTKRAYNMWIPPCLSPDTDMPTPSENLRETWLEALLPRVEQSGWTHRAARLAAEEAGLTAGEQALAAPNGVTDLIDHFFDRSMDRMLEALAVVDLGNVRTHERVAAALMAWLDGLEDHKAVVRKAAGRGLAPWGAGAAVQRVWSVADTIWDAAGDTATDYNRQTKRALLSATIPSIVLYWLDHDDPAGVEQFIERRLSQAMKLGQAGGKVIGPALDFIERARQRRDASKL